MASVNSIQEREQKAGGPAATQRYDPTFLRHVKDLRANTSHNRLTIRLMRFDAYFDRYYRMFPQEHVLRYGDIVSSGGRALQVFVPAARELDEPLEFSNLNPL